MFRPVGPSEKNRVVINFVDKVRVKSSDVWEYNLAKIILDEYLKIQGLWAILLTNIIRKVNTFHYFTSA